MYRLKDSVDIAIHDSPFIMGTSYINEDCPYKAELVALALAMHNSYDNLNILMLRDPNRIYQELGRHHTEEQALEQDKKIKLLLDNNKIYYIELQMENIIAFVGDVLKENDGR